jgi:hypothetical protein
MSCWVWWYTLVILALGRLTQEDLKFKTSLGYRVRSCLKQTNNQKNDILVLTTKHIELEDIMSSEIKQRKTNILHMLLHM